MAGPKTAPTFGGRASQKIIFLCPAFGELCAGISIISHGDVIKVAFSCDSSVMEEPQQLIDLFEANYKQFILGIDSAGDISLSYGPLLDNNACI